MTQIVDRQVEWETPWFQLVSRRVAGESAPYHSRLMQRILVPRGRLPELMTKAEFGHALHWAALLPAVVRHGPGLFA